MFVSCLSVILTNITLYTQATSFDGLLLLEPSTVLLKFNYCFVIVENKISIYLSNEHFSEFAPHHGGKTADIDTVRINYVIVILLK